jgi:uncharacterized damage-inducible protein DinB
MIEIIRTLYAYSAWANGRVIDTSAGLTPEQFLKSVGASFPSVRDTLVHTMSAQWMWLTRWKGTSPKAMLNPAEFVSLDSICLFWESVEEETRAFVAELDSAKLARSIRYANTRGEIKTFPLWQLMVHQVNHATQHRSEVAVMLTQFGRSPGLLDLSYWLDGKTKN